MENDIKNKTVALSEVLISDIDKIKDKLDLLFKFVNESRRNDFTKEENKHAFIDNLCNEISNLNYNDLADLKTEITMTR